MSNREIKHSVLMISYNQEAFISDALDSVLNQVPMPYEIIISDDASKDRTWDIIMSYQEKYPWIIKAKRNDVNMGVYRNINSILKSATGDVVSWLAGDDYYYPGIFSELNRVINENQIDIDNDMFAIITNFNFLKNDGSTKLYDNFKLKKSNVFKNRIRYGIFHREIGVSKKVFDVIDLMNENVGIHGDWLHTLQIDINCSNYYFTPFISCVYRVGEGIVSRSKSIEMYKSRLTVIEIIKEKYLSKLDESDIKFLEFEKNLNIYLIEDNFKTYFIFLKHYFKNINNFPLNNPWNSRERLLTLLPPKMRRILKKLR